MDQATKMRRESGRWLLMASAVFLFTGCGNGHDLEVEGKLLKGGVKYTPPAGHRVSVTFLALEATDSSGKPITNEPFQATLEADGESFTVPGRDGYGIPPGKYRIVITERMTREAFEAAKPKPEPGMPEVTRETDFFYDRFGTEKSPIIREVKGEPIIIDLDNPDPR